MTKKEYEEICRELNYQEELVEWPKHIGYTTRLDVMSQFQAKLAKPYHEQAIDHLNKVGDVCDQIIEQGEKFHARLGRDKKIANWMLVIISIVFAITLISIFFRM